MFFISTSSERLISSAWGIEVSEVHSMEPFTVFSDHCTFLTTMLAVEIDAAYKGK